LQASPQGEQLAWRWTVGAAGQRIDGTATTQ
jgi:hypothetical protein